MKNLLVSFIAIIFISLSIQAQAVSYINSNYAGETIEDSGHGYSFTAPAGWNVEKTEGKCAGVILSNSEGTINIVVKPHHSNSLANFYKNESNLSGQNFQQAGDIKELANNMRYVRLYKQTNRGNILLDMIFIPFSSQGGAVVMNFTTNEDLAIEAMRNTVNIIKSLRYSAPQSTGQSQQGGGSSSQGGLNSILASKRLYAEGGSSQTEIILCSSGRYTMNFNAFYSSGSSTSEETGSWSIQNSNGTYYLVLVPSSGEQTTYQISNLGESSVNLNNRQYSMRNAGC